MKKVLVFGLLLAVLFSLFTVTAFAESTDANNDVSTETSVDNVSTDSDISKEELSTNTTGGEQSKDGVISFEFSTTRFPTALKHMAIGMLGVLIVLSLIALVVFVLNKLCKPR